MSEQREVMPMIDFFISLLQKAAESFVLTLVSKLAERLAASKKKKTRKKPTPKPGSKKGKA